MKPFVTVFIILLTTAVMCGQLPDVNALKTQLSGPSDIVAAPNGDVYVIESDNNLVRKIDAATRRIITVAGNGKDEYSGDEGNATAAGLGYPTAIALDDFGNLYIAEISGRLRRVDAVTHVITTIAGNGKMGDGGTGDGGPAIAASFRRAEDLAFDRNGDLYVVDDMDHRVRKIDMATQIISTVVGNDWVSMAGESAAGDVLGDDRSARKAAVYFPQDMAFDIHDNMYIADYQNHRIRRVDKLTGIISTVAGTGVPRSTGHGRRAVRVSLKYPTSVVVDNVGNVFYSDSSGTHRIDSVSGRVSRMSRQVGDLALYGTNLYISRFNQNHIYKISLQTRRFSVFAGNGLPQRSDIIV
jgi:trimeric autotransporter adhesin